MGFATFRTSMGILPKQGFQSRSPQWRHTLRSLSPDHSRTVSPRPATFSPFQRGRARCDMQARHARARPPADLKVFLRSRIRCVQLGVAAELQLDAPLGFVPEEVPDRRALRSEERRAWMRRGKVPSRACARGADSVGRLPWVLPCPSRCVGPSVAPHLDDRATLRCDIPRRVASRCSGRGRAEARPVTETVRLCHLDATGGGNAAGAVVPVDFDHLASAVGFSRQALGAEALRVRTFPWCEMLTDSALPWATPLRESSVLSGKPERARSSRCGPLPVPLRPPASLPSGRGRLRAMAPGFTRSLGHTRECDFGTALLRARHAHRFARGPLAKAFRPPPAGPPIPATPRRRGARICRLAVRARQVTRPGAEPRVERTRYARPSNPPSPRCRSVEERAFPGDKTAGPVASQRARFRRRRSASGVACAVRLGTRGSLLPKRRNASVRALPWHHDLGSSASGWDGPQRRGV
jgi:hypothetical protein